MFICAIVQSQNHTAFLSTGSNIGNRASYLAEAKALLSSVCTVQKVSGIYETAAWGLENQAAFLNQVLQVETRTPANLFMQQILTIERRMGRERLEKWGPRSIDIDILLFDEEVHRSAALTIPHPQMQQRRFVLVPLAEIAPQLLHPVLHKTIQELLDNCSDPLATVRWK